MLATPDLPPVVLIGGLAVTMRVSAAGAAHRWAFESGHPARMTTTDFEPLDALVASTASLVATKCHALGFPTSRRRATKHASDLLDLFRLVQLQNRSGDLSRELREGPAGLARIIADVAAREVIANPVSATKQMSGAAREELDVDEVRVVIEDFFDELRG